MAGVMSRRLAGRVLRGKTLGSCYALSLPNPHQLFLSTDDPPSNLNHTRNVVGSCSTCLIRSNTLGLTGILNLDVKPLSTVAEPPQKEKPSGEYPSQNPNFKHQEIEGPTVERDLSPLGNETREVLESMMKNMYGVSRAVAVLGLLQLGLGAWISHAATGGGQRMMTELSSVQSVFAFSFPFAVAFLLRRSLKPMYFFKKMEEQGRLQILTLALQFSKNLNLLFRRLRLLSFLSVGALSLGCLYTVLFSNQYSSP